MFRKFVFFVAVYTAALLGTAVAIVLANGHPFTSMNGWEGVFALCGLLLIILIIAAALWALGKGSFDNGVLFGLVGGGTGAIILLGFVGLKWLMGPLRALLDGGGLWWPVVVLVTTAFGWVIARRA